ncbi:hypothetical protein, partial [Actinomyces sp. Z5]|uniref:hypothetical protein n=1 Tax=Actinomyces sp. Z5 TaxID=2250216 RepID=UPI0037C14029
MFEPLAQHSLEGWVDLGVQAPDTAPRSGWSWRARSRSKPVSILNAAASSSEALMDLSVWGMV